MLVRAKLRHVASKEWGTKKFLNMKNLYEHEKMLENEKEMNKAKVDVTQI